MDLNIFEVASRKKLRFPSTKNELTTEQLWDLPLTSASGFDLDTIAKGINGQLKAISEDSFVVTAASNNPAKAGLELRLEVLKHIIAVKMQDAADRRNKAEKDQKRAKLVELYGKKQDEALEQLSPEQILKQLEDLDK